MTGNAWKRTPLANYCEVFSGYPFKSSGFTDDPCDIPLVKGENVGQGEILWDISKRWSRQAADELERYKLVSGDVVLAMDRPWVPAGLKFAKITESAPEAFLVQRVARLRGRGGLVQDFLSHLIASPSFVAYVKNIGRGVGVPHISGKEIGAFEFLLPPEPVQRQIGSILSAYDGLIENNRRRMALLEESARLLYREWFVRLRFPGHEHTRIVDGVPRGWERKTLGEVARINRATLGSAFDGEIEYIDIASVTPNSINETTRYQFREAPGRARRVVRHGDIIWSCVRPNRCSHAVIWHPFENLIASTGFAVISPTSLPTSFLYQTVTNDSFVGYLANHAKGATYPAVVASDFERAEVLAPSSALVSAFNEFAEPMLSQAHCLRLQNQKLRAARDLLLPRLMSGEIVV